MPEQPKWGNVNLGVDVLQGHGEQSQPGKRDYINSHPSAEHKIQYNPGRNQELKLPQDAFRMAKDNDLNPNAVNGHMTKKGLHERIKELLGEGQISRKEALQRAKQEYTGNQYGDSGPIPKKEIYRSKYQAREPFKQISPLVSQIQNYPYV